ncbi:MAG: iron chelate uptake ABC transporter family permease subunit [Firmicutes bacterium]|nr:iron chelate uptake ABC transporter family permease subunit [Bacillota bacterium]
MQEQNKVLLSSGWQKQACMAGLLILLLASFICSIGIGTTALAKKDIIYVILEKIARFSPAKSITDTTRDIVFNIRLPRVILAAVVGASLSVAGTTFQGIFRNPLADPYIIGVSSGAALGATLAIVSGLSMGWAGFGAVSIMAFAGGVLTIMLVYQLSRQGNFVPVMTLLLAGIATNAFLSAFVSLLIYFAGERLHQVVFWMMGGLGGARWSYVHIMLPYFFLGFGVIYYFARELNALLLGEDTAQYLGIDAEKFKKVFLVAASLLVSAAVSTSGIIGFIGLVVPHIIRLVAGPDHRFLLPASALTGAVLLLGADTLARTIIAPAELPVGIITALLGAPFFLYLLRRRKKIRYFSGI